MKLRYFFCILVFLCGCQLNKTNQPVGDWNNKICPVLGANTHKALYTIHQNKKVYFCCQLCEELFEADPEKYHDSLVNGSYYHKDGLPEIFGEQ